MKKEFIIAGVIGIAIGSLGTWGVHSIATKQVTNTMKQAGEQDLTNVRLSRFADMMTYYVNHGLPEEYVMIEITKLASPLYEDDATRDLAFLMESASGIVADGDKEALTTFLKEKFAPGITDYGGKVDLDFLN